jgi:hypothetical protein
MSPLVIPDAQSVPTYPGQAVKDPTDDAAMLALSNGYGVVSGCLVSQDTGADMKVVVASGSILAAWTAVAVTGATLTVTAAGSFDRRDIVVSSNAGVLSVVAGTPCTVSSWTAAKGAIGILPPVKPAIPGGSVLLGEVYVPGGVSAIITAMIIDKTPILSSPAGVTSFNTRSGAVVPASGDYTAAQVTNAADKSSGSNQTFAATVVTPNLSATTSVVTPEIAITGEPGAATTSAWVGGTAGGAPVTGTWTVGSFIVDVTGKIFICTVAGTPGTWVDVSSTRAPSLALGASQSTNFTAAANTLYPCSATLTATLPVTPAVGTMIGVYRSAVSQTITLAAGAGGTINGLASVSISNTSLLVDPLIMVQATSSTTWIIISAFGTDAGQGFVAGGALKSVGQLSFNVGFVGHSLAKTANYTTLNTDWWINCTSNSFTVTLGTTTFAAGCQQLVTNPGTGTITMAAVSGTLSGPTTLPPKSGAIFTYDGTSWNCDGSWGTVTDSSAWVTISNPAITSGVAFTCSATSDGELLVPVTLGGTGTVTFGPTTGAENTILPAGSVLVAGAPLVKHIPKGWKVVITLVTATLGTAVFTPF